MKLAIIYNNHLYSNDKVIQNVKNQILTIVYINPEDLNCLSKLYNNNIIIRLVNINNLNIKDGDYSLDMYSLFFNNGRLVRIDDKTYMHNPIHKFINVSIKHTDLNAKIIYHNLIYYSTYIIMSSIIIFTASYYIFNMDMNIDLRSRAEILKTFT